MTKVELQLWPKGGAAAAGGVREFARVPVVGEIVAVASGERFVVVNVEWLANGSPRVIAHSDQRGTVRASDRLAR
jgi:hypothetical protein